MSTDTGHREGCSFGRTARCNCTYLAQWDKTPEYTAPPFRADGVPVVCEAPTFRVESAAEFLASGPRTLEEALTQDFSNNRLAGKGTLQIPLADGSYAEYDLNTPDAEPIGDKALRPAREVPWYQTPAFAYACGVLAAGAPSWLYIAFGR